MIYITYKNDVESENAKPDEYFTSVADVFKSFDSLKERIVQDLQDIYGEDIVDVMIGDEAIKDADDIDGMITMLSDDYVSKVAISSETIEVEMYDDDDDVEKDDSDSLRFTAKKNVYQRISPELHIIYFTDMMENNITIKNNEDECKEYIREKLDRYDIEYEDTQDVIFNMKMFNHESKQRSDYENGRFNHYTIIQEDDVILSKKLL